MKEFFYKYGMIIAVVLVLVIHAAKEHQAKTPVGVSTVKNTLVLENARLNSALQQSRAKEVKLQQDIAEKTEKIKGLDDSLTLTRAAYLALKAEQANLPPVEDPVNFVALQECQEKYTALASRLNICLATNEKGETALNLCLEKSAKQQELLDLQEQKYLECEGQVELTTEKLLATESALEKIQGIYQRKLVKKCVIKCVVSTIAGIAVGYFFLKRK